MKIYVAGHLGLVGSSIVNQIELEGKHNWVGKTRSELDLLDRSEVFKYLLSTRPDAIIIAAAKVGGIHANSTYPVEFLSQNLQIETNLIDASHAAGVERLIFLGSSCIYPKLCPQPIKEEYLLTGPLEATNEAYALAKISGVKLVSSYNKQYGKNWRSIMPTNLYGPGDNFEKFNSHVLPALIGKIHHAVASNLDEVQVWGDGTPLREFLYSQDLAAACLRILEVDAIPDVINVGSGEEISIANLAQLIAEEIGFQGRLVFERSMPNGTPRKVLDSSIATSIGWSPKVSLREGIQSTYAWYLENHVV